MSFYSFKNDYSLGCHPAILKALTASNMQQEDGYGRDCFSQKAVALIRRKIQNENADVYFVSGGTQANLISIASILRPHESVICATTGHINFEEAGAIEATGHKVLTIDCEDGKLTPEKIQQLLTLHGQAPHYLKPALVYLANSTEIGTVYSKDELEAISRFCQSKNLYLYLDGARLASAVMAENAGLTLADVAALTDFFYIGGTKIGAFLGEAIVIVNDRLKQDFHYHIKQRGGMLAKGRLLGIQFLTLFENDLYFTLGKHVNDTAQKIARSLAAMGVEFFTQSTSNQIFPIFPTAVALKIQQQYDCYTWTQLDKDRTVIRLVTSWSTQESEVEEFIKEVEIILLSVDAVV